MARDQNPELLRSLAIEVGRIVAAHLDDGALILRWLRVLLDAERDDAIPGFNHVAFLDVVGGEILRAAPNDERARSLVGELLLPKRPLPLER